MARQCGMLAKGAFAALWLALSPAWAQERAERFVDADGFSARGAEELGRARSAVGAGATPIERALATLDALEARIDRVRYVVRRERRDGADAEWIEVARFNLGPTLRAEAIKEYGRENVDAPKAFGVGPHVVWRFALTRGGDLVSASRREGTGALEARRCPLRACLSTDTLADRGKWTEIRAPSFSGPARPYRDILDRKDGGREIAPARIAFDLDRVAEASTDRASGSEGGVDEMVIDRNLGQEIAAEAALIGAAGQTLRCGYGIAPQGATRTCWRAASASRRDQGREPKTVRPPAFSCVLYAASRFEGARHALKAEKPGRGLVYGDAPSLPAAVSGKVASVACAPGCAFFAHDGEDHDGEEFKGAAGATLADLGVWTGRIRSAGISCAP